MSFLTSIFGEGVGAVLKPISDIVDNAITNKEEKIKAETELQRVLLDYESKVMAEVTKREGQILSDIANARAMNIKSLDNQDKFIRRFPYYLAAGVLLCIFGLFLFIITGEVTTQNEAIVYTILGTLSGAAISILSFFYGTTRGAESKNETIKTLAKNQDVP